MTAREIIEEAQLLIGDPNVDFHDRTRMLFALNRATHRISTRSRSIHELWFRPVDEGRYEYPLPEGSLYIRKVKYKQGAWKDLDRGFYDSVEARAAQSGGGSPRTFSLWQNTRLEKFIGTVQEAEVDLDRVEKFQRHIVIGLPVDGELIRLGDFVFNLSAGHGEGVVTSIESIDVHNFPVPVYKLRHNALMGGMRDHFVEGDEIRITSPHSSGHVIIIAPAPSRTDGDGEESLAAFVARQHRIIKDTDISNDNDSLELDAEFSDSLMYEMLHWARVQRTGLDTTAQLYRQLANEEYLTAMPLVENRISQNLNAWERSFSVGNAYRDVSVKDNTGAGFNNVKIA